MGWGWIGLGVLHMGLFWILVILGIVVLVKWLVSGSPGEITREQFEQMKREIGD